HPPQARAASAAGRLLGHDGRGTPGRRVSNAAAVARRGPRPSRRERGRPILARGRVPRRLSPVQAARAAPRPRSRRGRRPPPLPGALLSDAPPHAGLLAADEPAPLRVLRPDGRSPFLLTADHAGALIPRRLGLLGLPESERRRHIA